jgi:peptidoglycan/xylan/chitin deacetylase (PgdA/CDA1 family)
MSRRSFLRGLGAAAAFGVVRAVWPDAGAAATAPGMDVDHESPFVTHHYAFRNSTNLRVWTDESGEERYARFCADPGTVALTFDDGPDIRHDATMHVLDTLAAYGATATFFVLGWRSDRNPELLAAAAERGHSIQVHGYEHVPMTSLSSASIQRSVEKTARSIHDATGTWPTCVRPPYGAGASPFSRVYRALNDIGYGVVWWDYDSADWTPGSSAGRIRSRANSYRAGMDVLCHDTNWQGKWERALAPVLEELLDRGIGFSTIGDVRRPSPGRSAIA